MMYYNICSYLSSRVIKYILNMPGVEDNIKKTCHQCQLLLKSLSGGFRRREINHIVYLFCKIDLKISTFISVFTGRSCNVITYSCFCFECQKVNSE